MCDDTLCSYPTYPIIVYQYKQRQTASREYFELYLNFDRFAGKGQTSMQKQFMPVENKFLFFFTRINTRTNKTTDKISSDAISQVEKAVLSSKQLVYPKTDIESQTSTTMPNLKLRGIIKNMAILLNVKISI